LYDLKSTTGKCANCGHKFVKKVQKGVDVGYNSQSFYHSFKSRIATKLLESVYERPIQSLVLIAGSLFSFFLLHLTCKGDGDFKDAILLALRNKKDIFMVGFQNRTMSSELQEVATKVIWLDEEISWKSISKEIKKLPPKDSMKNYQQKKFFAEALFDFNGGYSGSLKFHQGDILTVLDSSKEEWWFASIPTKKGPILGWIPSGYVTEIPALQSGVDIDAS
jgi:hypothetical protein